MILIVPDGDFLIRLAAPKMSPCRFMSNNRCGAVDFRVSRNVMAHFSTYFHDLLRMRPDVPSIHIDNPNPIKRTFETWPRAIHGEELPPTLKAQSSRHIWEILALGQNFGFLPDHVNLIVPWFLNFYSDVITKGGELTPMTARTLVFPCVVFDHAEGLMRLTKYLVYDTNGGVFWHNPSTSKVLDNDARALDGKMICFLANASFYCSRTPRCCTYSHYSRYQADSLHPYQKVASSSVHLLQRDRFRLRECLDQIGCMAS
jgi:hypothetical protein